MYYENANKEFCKIVDYGMESFDFGFIEEQCFKGVVAYVHGKYIVLQHKTENKWLLIKQLNRFQPEYRERFAR